jgi:hypothetical protein
MNGKFQCLSSSRVKVNLAVLLAIYYFASSGFAHEELILDQVHHTSKMRSLYTVLG